MACGDACTDYGSEAALCALEGVLYYTDVGVVAGGWALVSAAVAAARWAC